MKITKLMFVAVLVAAVPAGRAVAADKKAYVVVNEDVGVPVFAYDLTDRPYKVLGEVKAGVRRGMTATKEVSQAEIYRSLWERAEALGADAVVNARYGESHISAFSFGKTNATGTAIRFLASGEAAK